ncbi:CBL-interacting protein kinase 32-like isoform X2 [Andrographis paniculata]|uniref:CBL-interacting protein kinase 32-like isoform X2 n=1 Tax=Andrographis paniculata TaxID=175694 RepID=UPI0021E8FF88|nr:CBL-interacting protein kinase 32-like isoform X2 [Andrographis paniculata]
MQEDEARKSFKQLINVVDYCHSRGVFDRDTKPENLLDVRARNFKFSDFGLSVLSEEVGEDGMENPKLCTPEVLDDQGYERATAD